MNGRIIDFYFKKNLLEKKQPLRRPSFRQRKLDVKGEANAAPVEFVRGTQYVERPQPIVLRDAVD